MTIAEIKPKPVDPEIARLIAYLEREVGERYGVPVSMRPRLSRRHHFLNRKPKDKAW